MANPAPITLHTSGAETTSGTGASSDMGATRRAAELTLNVTAISGTGASLTARLETAPTSGGAWKPAGQFAVKNATGYERVTFGDLEQFVRIAWDIVGSSPSITFSVSGEAHVTYADPRELAFRGIIEQAIEDLTELHKVEAMLGATGLADSYLASAYTMPLVSWGRELRRCIAHLAPWDLMVTRGFNPDQYDSQIKVRYDEAIKWLAMIRDGEIKPPDIIDSTPDTDNKGKPRLFSKPERGWDFDADTPES